MFRSFLRSRRGVSEIVGSLAMLLVVSVAGALLYSYSLSAFSLSGSSFQIQTSRGEELARERFTIVAVWWDTTDQLNVTILNYGEIELAIDAVYFDGTKASAYASGRGQIIVKGEIVSVKFTSPVSIVDGQTYEILAVSERGGKNEVYWKA